MNVVEHQFVQKGLNRAGIIMYPKSDALDFIKECSKHRIRILGIDGFFITDTITQPSLEDSIDFSAASSVEVVCEKAVAFIESRNIRLYFEIVCD